MSVNIVTDLKNKDNTTVRLKTNYASKLTCISENSNPPCKFTWFIGKNLKD